MSRRRTQTKKKKKSKAKTKPTGSSNPKQMVVTRNLTCQIGAFPQTKYDTVRKECLRGRRRKRKSERVREREKKPWIWKVQ